VKKKERGVREGERIREGDKESSATSLLSD